MSDCVSCNTPPSPCNCSPFETCVQTPRNCTTCPQNICISTNESHSNNSNLSSTIGGALGGLFAGLIIITLSWFIYKRNLLPSFLSSRFPSNSKTSSNHQSKLNNHHLNQNSSNQNQQQQNQTISNFNLNRTLSNKTLQSKLNYPHQSLNQTDLNLISSQTNQINPSSTDQQNPPLVFFSSFDPSTYTIHHDKKTDSISSKQISDDDPFLDSLNLNEIQNNLNPSSDLQSSINNNLSPINLIPSSPLIMSSNSQIQSSKINSLNNSVNSSSASSASTTSSSSKPPPVQNLNLSNNLIINSNVTNLSLPESPPNTFKPTRPHRAPDLDLRLLPSSQNQSINPNEISQSSQNLSTLNSSPTYNHQNFNLNIIPSNSLRTSPSFNHNPNSINQSPNHSRLSSSFQNSDLKSDLLQTRPDSTLSHSTNESHLSSILDPAMIVTPITLVRTASGRQAAVQRVALRGQERARVVRLQQTNNLNSNNRLSSIPASATPDNIGFNISSSTSQIGLEPNDLKRLSLKSNNHQTLTDSFKNQTSSSSNHLENLQVEKSPNPQVVEGLINQSPSHQLDQSLTNRDSSIDRISYAASSTCDSLIDEDVEFPTVLGRSVNNFRKRSIGSKSTTKNDLSLPMGNTPHYQLPLKAIGRDRAISLSSIINKEVNGSFDSSPPPLPTDQSHLISNQTNSPTNTTFPSLPEPFKPFAGQRPGLRNSNKQNNTISMALSSRPSSTSTMRSGYGSVLEGIPFNIGFNSENDDLFGARGSILEAEDEMMGIDEPESIRSSFRSLKIEREDTVDGNESSLIPQTVIRSEDERNIALSSNDEIDDLSHQARIAFAYVEDGK
ncbi:hypothetical protein O181_068529 [Austropuccinia psidii MF-1]|uniref:Membrane anchor Opy2 N-terminal domain-containing protein n=1 Tax=Austropuccinia psidii MF-1 TaxID=1389203 RepID=A0A9Q3EXG9_9BASI|nr:hypothetical protein [Austropuccinia psidii MF-1]